MKKKLLLSLMSLALVAAVCVACPYGASAQTYPTKPINFIVPFPPERETTSSPAPLEINFPKAWGNPW